MVERHVKSHAIVARRTPRSPMDWWLENFPAVAIRLTLAFAGRLFEL